MKNILYQRFLAGILMLRSFWRYLLGVLFLVGYAVAVLSLIFSWGNPFAFTTIAATMAAGLILTFLLLERSE